MKAKRNITVGGAWVVALFIASLAVAQDKVDDRDLLKLLKTVEEEQTSKPMAENLPVDPQARALESVKADEEPVAESNAAPVAVPEDGVDDTSAAVVPEAGEDDAPAAAAPEDGADDAPAVAAPEAGEDDAPVVAVPEAGDDEAPAVAAPEGGVDDASVDDLDMDSYDVSAVSTAGNLISIRLNKVGLEEAINLFAQLSGANIIVPELTEAAQISVNLKDVEWRPALQSILDTYNYELYQRVSGSNVYSVRRRPAGAPEPQVVETFTLKYATVPNAAMLIRELLPADAKVSEFASRNMIVVKSTESSLGEVRAVLDTIDKVRQQVFIESKFMELSDKAQKDLGFDWQVLQSYSAGTAGKTSYGFSRNRSDDRTTSTFTDAAGNSYAVGQGFANSGSLAPGVEVFEGLIPSVQDVNGDVATKVLTSVLNADEFRMVLSALNEDTGANVVSNPKIIVANEEKANISLVRKEPNLKQERQQTGGGDAPIDNITFTLDEEMPFFEYGIKLDVTPSINTSSNITVQINPSLTRFVRDKPAGANTYPIIDEKSIETIFNLASGQTAAIGGLTEITDDEVMRKIPVLGSLPFLGRLFSWEHTVHDRKETIIFVTVGLANTQEIDEEIGMPSDSELARRQIIRDRNGRLLRNQGRTYYQAEEADKLEDMLKVMKQKEDMRIEHRLEARRKEQEKADQKAAKQKEVASLK